MHRAQVVVIGAGMSGLAAANSIAEQGIEVLCLEKARGTGGRLSSKRINLDEHGVLSFDLGASSFYASSERFVSFIEDKCSSMQGMTRRHYVPNVRSSSLTRALAESVRLECGVKVSDIKRRNGRWLTFVEDEHGSPQVFSESLFLVLATPPEQARALIPPSHPYQAALEFVSSQPQWVSVYLVPYSVYEHIGLQVAGPLLNLNCSEIKRLSVESAKPGRTESLCNDEEQEERCVLVKLEAQPEWTNHRLELDKNEIASELWAALLREFGLEGDSNECQFRFQYTHRWLYSLPSGNVLSRSGEVTGSHHQGPHENLCLCGDYLGIREGIDGVEAAYQSGLSLAEAMVEMLTDEPALTM
ncbi:NAD(P)/FAD-dependent oxidoreductase [Litoribrevibacter albus]|uniref:Amine oxidase domain-containing protein n=1 Tax=Litoribrevibacter albus TaxID=1473156 RepID=A0AA37S9M3_9GAMM|nr:FAD-dependent oxidoreductase [Litoribrevibacter albus]GLQ30800.1 hypothetical protein GCM10007876_12790 [Litoribrevibacter albus]